MHRYKDNNLNNKQLELIKLHFVVNKQKIHFVVEIG